MTEELKALLKAAKTEEEAKEILLAHKSELTEEEQEKINGGELWVLGYYDLSRNTVAEEEGKVLNIGAIPGWLVK